MNKNIFSNSNLDIIRLFLIFPIAWSVIFIEEYYLKYISFLVLILFDYNHIFNTMLRFKYKDDQLEIRKKLPIYLLITLIIIFFLSYFSYDLLISMAIYYNFYHIYKQHEGIVKWYLKKDENQSLINLINFNRILVFLFILSVHFKPNFFINIFSNVPNKSDFLFHFQNPLIFNILQNISILGFCGFLFYVLCNLYNKKYIWSNLYSFFLVTTYFFSGFVAENFFQLYIMHALVHGLHYLIIIWYSNIKISSRDAKNIKRTNILYSIFFVIISILFFIFESQAENYLNIYAFSALYFIPQWIHYYLDSFLWKKGNSNWEKISS